MLSGSLGCRANASARGALSRRFRGVEGGLIRRVHRVLESIKAGHRLPEAPFATVKLAPKGQKSVYGLFKNAGTEGDRTAAAGVERAGSVKDS